MVTPDKAVRLLPSKPPPTHLFGSQHLFQRSRDAAEVLSIASVAGNDVQVEMKNALPGGGAAIHQQFEAVGMVIALQQFAQLEAEVKQGSGFLSAELKEIARVAARDDEAMSFRDGVDVPDGEKMFVLQQYPVRSDGAKRAVHNV